MAVVAIIVTGNVCRVFSRRGNAVVARAAGADDLCMVDGDCRRERRGSVAILADVGRL